MTHLEEGESLSNFQDIQTNPTRVVLQIDVREHKLLDHIRAHPDQHPHIHAVLQDPPPALPLGDMILKVDGEPMLVIERKTLADLLASVKDGRYRDQKGRLLQSYPRERVLYVLEASAKQWSFKMRHGLGPVPVDTKIVASSLINLLVRDRIAWIQLQELEETAAFLEQVVQRVREKPDMYAGLSERGQQRPDTPMLSSCMSLPPPMARKDQITPASCFRMQLAQIPGVSYAKAQAIAETLGVTSMCDFIKVLSGKESNVTKASTKTLLTVPGIGKKLAQAIGVHLGLA